MGTKYEPTEAELQVAFMAARECGKVLSDEVLNAILIAVNEVRTQEIQPKVNYDLYGEYSDGYGPTEKV